VQTRWERRERPQQAAAADWPHVGEPGQGVHMTDVKSLMIGALLVVVAVLGYLIWEKQRNTVEIRLPSVTIEKH
jgi:hypothetical protein